MDRSGLIPFGPQIGPSSSMRVPQSRGGIRGFFTNLGASGISSSISKATAHRQCLGQDEEVGVGESHLQMVPLQSDFRKYSQQSILSNHGVYHPKGRPRWTGPTRMSIINFLVYCNWRVVYHKSVNSSDEIHDAYYISKLMTKLIEEIGPQNIDQVIADNGANFKRAAYCVDLMMKYIGDIPMVKSTIKKAEQITRFIYNHTWVHALMKKFTEEIIIAVEPLYKVLRQVDMEKTPQMSHLYHYIHQAQEEIKRVMISPAKYKHFIEIISRIWDNQMGCDIHIACEPPRPSPIISDIVESKSQPEDTDSQAIERDMTLAPLDSQRVRQKRTKKTSPRFIAVATPVPTDLWTNEQYFDHCTQDQDHDARTGGTTRVYEKRGRRRGGGPTALQDYHHDMMSSLQEVSESTYSVSSTYSTDDIRTNSWIVNKETLMGMWYNGYQGMMA
ncbi:hypothetical protein Cni_G28902 [Canna indica]|uniref:DUF659 domain-containing protein n=1 Tax=Canna indica TaxID=4628 RepID=A0AAQ3QTI3_9LILI|nr:hypothetical protein Cni_G28902 [Canna indica]